MKLVDVVYDSNDLSYKDFSGFNRTITKIGSGNWKITPPLTSKTYNAIRITPSSKLSIANVPIGKYSHERESFSINLYFKTVDGSTCRILYSEQENFGIRFDSNKIIFVIKSDSGSTHELSYIVPTIEDSYHISATYDDRRMSLIINGNVEASTLLSDSFKFKSLSDITLISQDSTFLIDRVQILNEVLSLGQHQLELRQDKYLQYPDQIFSRDGAYYWGFDINNKQIDDSFEYGINKSFSTATLTNLELDEFGYLIVSEGSLQGTLEDKHFFPSLALSSHNQIEWDYDSGITFEYSLDGINYSYSYNYSNIENFSGGYLYYRVTINAGSKLRHLKFISFKDIKLPSDNSLFDISSNGIYTVGNRSGLLIDHSNNMGIKKLAGSGIKIEDMSIHSVEFLYNPQSIANPGILLECGIAKYAWDINGSVAKANIQDIYVNGKNLTGETDISLVFSPGIWHHVVVEFTTSQTDTLFINQNSSGSVAGQLSRFAHLALYNDDMAGHAVNHYNYLTTKVVQASATDTINLGSESYNAFSVDKVIISTQ